MNGKPAACLLLARHEEMATTIGLISALVGALTPMSRPTPIAGTPPSAATDPVRPRPG